jgi:hypothetical protein
MSTYSSLKFELILTGDQSGQWGNTTNANIGTAIEQAIVGMATLTSANFVANEATLTLTDTNAAQNARALCLNIAAGAVSVAGTINVPAIQKPYIIINGSSYTITVKVSGQTGVAVPAGKRTVVYNNGTDVGNQIDYLATLALGTALPATSGGTGQSSYVVGDLLYANTTTTLAKLADIATGNALISGGVTTAPSWGKIGLTTHVSGTLGATNGGTGASTTTTGDLLYGSASNTWTALAGNTTTTRKYLVSVGSGSAATAPDWDQIDIGTTDITGTLAATNGGTGTATVTTGDILYGGTTSNTWAKLAAGTAGQLLQTNGAAAPSWVDAPTFTGVSSFSGGSTGLLPSSATTGAVSLSGTLAVANGGTGVTTSTGTGSVVLSITPTFTGTVLNNIGTFTSNVFPGPNGSDVTSTETGITLKYSTPFVSTGGTTKNHYGFVSSPTVTNTGASGNQGLNVSGVASFPNIISSGASTSAQTGYGGYFQFNRTNAADLGSVSNMYGVYGAALTSGSFGGTSSSMYGGRFLANQQVGSASGFIVGVRGTANIYTSASTMMAGVYSDVFCGNSTNLTQPIAYNFLGEASIGSTGSGTIVCQNFYGLYLKSPTLASGASITNHYGVYQQSTTAQNYFGGGLTVQGLTVGLGNGSLATNTAFGVDALAGNTSTENVAVGYNALITNANGFSNTALGAYALNTNGNGDYNTAVGHSALYNFSYDDNNTAIGNYAGGTLTDGSNNVFLGNTAQPSNPTMNNEITLGNGSIVRLRCAVTSITALSDVRDKYDIEDLPVGLDFINSLKARRFKWDKRDAYFDEVKNETGPPTQVAVPKDGSRKSDEWNEGFIAQEVDEAATAAGADWMKIVYKSNPEKLEMAPGKLIPVLVKAIQELTARLEALEARN